MSNELNEKIIGLDLEHKFKLLDADITTTETLTERASARSGRRKLSKEIEVDESEILDWMNRIDLMRVEGIGPFYADLLEESGVDTVIELAKRNPQSLHQEIEKILEDMPFMVDDQPTLEQAESWIAAAAKLDRLIEY